MHQVNRRQLLKTTGAGAGIALAAGATSGVSADGSADVVQTGPVVTTFTATAETGRIGIDRDDPDDVTEFSAADMPDEDAVAQFEGELLRTGAWRTDDFVLVDLTNAIQALDLPAELGGIVEDFDLEEWVDETELDDVLEVVEDVIQALNIDPDFVEGLRTALDEILEEELGGFLGIEDIEEILFGGLEEGYTLTDFLTGADVEALRVFIANLGELLDLVDDFLGASVSPDEDDVPDLPGPDDLVLEDVINLLLNLGDFEDIGELEDELAGIVADLAEDLPDILADVDLNAQPGAVGGAFDPRDGDPVQVTAPIDGLTVAGALDNDDELALELPLSFRFTSGTSGDREGAIDLDTGEVTLVDNEFVAGLDELDIPALVGELGLEDMLDDILDDFDLDEILEDALGDFIDPEELDLDIEELLANIDIVAVVEAVGIQGIVEDLIEDEPGRHVLELDFEFDFDGEFDPGEWPLPTQPLPGGEGVPRDATGLGAFGDVNGDGVVDIQDVQFLFDSMPTINADGPIAAENDVPIEGDIDPAGFNFSRTSDDRVTVFDVQALFTRVQG